MNEFITTLRSIHLLLIAIAVAVCAIALSPRDSEIYHAAQLEAEFLQKIDFDRFVDVASEAGTYAHEHFSAEIRAVLAAPPFGLTIKVPDKELSKGPLVMWWPSRVDSLSKIREFTDEFHYDILSIDYNLVGNYEVTWGPVFGRAAQKKSGNCLEKVSRPGQTGVAIKSCPALSASGELQQVRVIEVNPLPPPKGRIEDGISLKEIGARAFVQVFTVAFANGLVVQFAAPPSEVGREYVPNKRNNLPCVWLHRKAKPELYPDDPLRPRPRPVAWEFAGGLPVTSPCFEQHSRESNTYFSKLYPNLDSLWSQVAHLTAAEAAAELSAKSMQARQSMSIGGVSVDERIVSIAGPFAVLSVSVYLLCNIVMLRSALRAAHPTAQSPLLFPWLCLYSDQLSRLITFLTIAFLPPASILALLVQTGLDWHWRNWHWRSLWNDLQWSSWYLSTALGLVTLCMVMTCSYFSLRALSDVKRIAISQ